MIEVDPARFEEMVGEALDGLPEELGRLMSNVAVTVEHDPGPPGLLGLYEGIPLTSRTTGYAGVLPDRITIYRLAICAVCQTERDVVEEVVLLGGPSKGWNCDDVKFYLAFLTVDRLEPEYRDKLNAIPTRLTLTPQQVDDSIEAGRRGALALRRLQQYIRERVGH